MTTKEIEWTGQERNIPKYGIANLGDTKILPTKIADSFIKQGLCKETKPKTATKGKEANK